MKDQNYRNKETYSIDCYNPKENLMEFRWAEEEPLKYAAQNPSRGIPEAPRHSQVLMPNVGIVKIDSLNEIEIKFNELAAKWRKETGGYSTLSRIAGNDNYLDIIGMGMPVVPFILRDLVKEADFWYIALNHITKANPNPVPVEHIGDIEKMRIDWITWGEKNMII